MKKLLLLSLFVSAYVVSNGQGNIIGGYQGLYAGALSSFGNSIPSVPSFRPKKETIGSQYVFEDWVSGSVEDNDGKIFSEGYLFNFNKINQNLYFRLKDSAVAFLVNRSLIKNVNLNDGTRTVYFEKVAALNPERFYRVLVKGEKYSLYSYTETSFVPANYFTNGYSSSGSMYDQFKDVTKYFVVFANGSSAEVPLRRKALRKIFEADTKKVDFFFKTSHAAGVFGEETLIALVKSLSS